MPIKISAIFFTGRNRIDHFFNNKELAFAFLHDFLPPPFIENTSIKPLFHLHDSVARIVTNCVVAEGKLFVNGVKCEAILTLARFCSRHWHEFYRASAQTIRELVVN